MAERFSDPLFEKINKLSIRGWCMWLKYFEIEDEANSKQSTEELAKRYEDRGGYLL